MVFIVEKTAYSPGRNNIVHTQIDVSYDLVCEPLDDHIWLSRCFPIQGLKTA